MIEEESLKSSGRSILKINKNNNPTKSKKTV